MKKKILNILVVILTIGVIYEISSYFIIKSNNKVLEDIKTVDTFDNKDKTLSIMIQQEDYSYKEDTSRTTWPSRDEYMYVGSKCVDKDNKDLGEPTKYISFEETSPNPTVTIKTKKTIYCTLYFTKGRLALEVLDKQGGTYYADGKTGDSKVAVDGLYRFKGTYQQVINNYICLGDENPDVCKTNPDNMYRIIGVTTDGKLKVIKASKSSSQKWFSSYSDSRTWNNSLAYAYLNGTSSEEFYGSLNGRIKELIEKHTWNMEKRTSISITVGSEDGTVSNYIGLMYASDYKNAGAQDTTNWLFIQNGMSGNTSDVEWTMSRYGMYAYDTTAAAWYIDLSGKLSFYDLSWPYAVRPVFYLISTTGLIGFGTEQQPYTITTIK